MKFDKTFPVAMEMALSADEILEQKQNYDNDPDYLKDFKTEPNIEIIRQDAIKIYNECFPKYLDYFKNNVKELINKYSICISFYQNDMISFCNSDNTILKNYNLKDAILPKIFDLIINEMSLLYNDYEFKRDRYSHQYFIFIKKIRLLEKYKIQKKYRFALFDRRIGPPQPFNSYFEEKEAIFELANYKNMNLTDRNNFQEYVDEVFLQMSKSYIQINPLNYCCVIA